MIPRATATITRDGVLPGKQTKLSISDEHLPQILGILTNMYSDIQLAILREISINALDSHKKVGNTAPILVNTPNSLHPFLEIEDFGEGMSVDFVENEFSKYGVSTKRTNNVEAGAFGIGGKSPLGYTDQYTLTTRKDGEEGVFVISRDEEGAAVITTLEGWPRPTNKPNGVKFSIPVRSTDDFTEKVDWFFKFWEPGTVLVNGEPPRQMEAKRLTNEVWFTPEGKNSYLVMGNIPYRVSNQSRYLPYNFQKFNYVIYVPVGTVSVVPSREALEYGDDATQEALKSVGQAFQEKMLDMVRNEITSQPNHFEAWKKWKYWLAMMGSDLGEITYKGDKFVDFLKVDGWRWVPSRGRHTLYRLRSDGPDWRDRVPISELSTVVVKSTTQNIPFT